MKEDKKLKSRKLIRILFLTALILSVILPVLSTDRRNDVVSAIDNMKFEELDLSEGLKPQSADKYMSERIGYREKAIALYGDFNNVLLNKLENPIYTYGKDGEVYFIPVEEKVDYEFLDDFTSFLKQIQDYCEARGSQFLYCINPEKAAVMPEFLPSGYKYSEKHAEYLKKQLDSRKIHYIDNLDILKTMSLEERVYEKAYDVGHWNDRGMMAGTNEILSIMKEKFPAIKLLNEDDFEIKTSKMVHLPLSRITINEEVENWTKKDTGTTDITDEYEGIGIIKSYPYFHVYNTPGIEDTPRVLFFHGSYYNRNPGMYSSSFKEVYGVHSYGNLLNFAHYYNIFKPEYVILESADFTVNRNFFDPYSVKNAYLNEPLEKMIKKETPKVSSLSALLTSDEKASYEGLLKGNKKLFIMRVKNPAQYNRGYISDGTNTYDMTNDREYFNCTVNTDHFDLQKATVYFFR